MDIDQSIGDEEIVVGDRVDIVAQMGQVYRTMIEDRLNNGPFLVGIPSRRGVFMQVDQDDDLYLVFYRETGRYIAQMKVIALETRGAVRYMWLLQKTTAQKNQRREAFRLLISFDVHIFEYGSTTEISHAYWADEVNAVSTEEVNSRDLSVTGISLLTRKAYELEGRHILKLHMDLTPPGVRERMPVNTTPALYLTATVKRCAPWRAVNSFNTGMQFFGVTKNMSEGIARYVLDEQQKQIKRRRLL